MKIVFLQNSIKWNINHKSELSSHWVPICAYCCSDNTGNRENKFEKQMLFFFFSGKKAHKNHDKKHLGKVSGLQSQSWSCSLINIQSSSVKQSGEAFCSPYIMALLNLLLFLLGTCPLWLLETCSNDNLFQSAWGLLETGKIGRCCLTQTTVVLHGLGIYNTFLGSLKFYILFLRCNFRDVLMS